jgi:hypothetical protein
MTSVHPNSAAATLAPFPHGASATPIFGETRRRRRQTSRPPVDVAPRGTIRPGRDRGAEAFGACVAPISFLIYLHSEAALTRSEAALGRRRRNEQ